MTEIFLSPFLQVLFDRVVSPHILKFFESKKLDGLLTKLGMSLLSVNKVLDHAQVKLITDKYVKEWLEELQDALYDAEDLLDAVNTGVMQGQLESSSHANGEMETKLKAILERLEDIVGDIDALGLKEGIGTAEKPHKRLPTTSLAGEHTVYGKEDDKESILKLLLDENSSDDPLGVITLKGMDGLRLAQLVYNDNKVDQHFGFKSWVCISEEFDVFKVIRSILRAVTSLTSEIDDLDLLQDELRKNFLGKKFLLVLDDVWNEEPKPWEMLKRPLKHGAKGSKILVISRNERVAEIIPTTSLPDELIVYKDKKKYVEKLLLADNSSDDNLTVITIKGMGGVGKTTLAQLVYHDHRIAKYFDLRAWVCMSEDFDVVKVTKTILQAVISSTSVTDDLDLLQVELQKNLEGKKFLLVLDDVWNVEDPNPWMMLTKPLRRGAKGSKILVTTRNERAAQITRTIPTLSLESPKKKLPTTSLLDEIHVYGRYNDKESIVNLLLAENLSLNSPDVITIKGMGGIGKTTLAQYVYNDKRIVEHFEFQAWVCISEEFDVFKVTKTILERVISSPSVTDDLDLMQVELKNNLVGKKFLVVLDDVWNENREDWDQLKKPFQHGAKGSKVLVTTRNDGVAQIMRTVPTHYPEELSNEDCWELFAKYAFEGGKSQPDQRFIDKGREIVKKKCGGLPLAAKALGSLLRSKKTIKEWSKIEDSNVWDLEDKNCNIVPVLSVSYHYLPARLKRCFAFASIFPKGYKFEKEELILLWAAHSFFPEGVNVADIGSEYFNELISRSFFQRSRYSVLDSTTDDLFVMHDLMHDLATFLSRQSCCCCVNYGDIQEITKTTRHISYSKEITEQFQTLPATLRTFAQVEGDVIPPILYPGEISDVLTRFKLLRVLSLRQYYIEVLPEIIGSLKHLRYFDLSETEIKRLPNSICDLYNLQTLILTYCENLIDLPTDIWKLVNLHYLDITGCYELQKMPKFLDSLKSLERLERVVMVLGSNGGNIRVLGPLPNLGGELYIFALENVVSVADAEKASLKDMKYLEKLELSWDDTREAWFEDEYFDRSRGARLRSGRKFYENWREGRSKHWYLKKLKWELAQYDTTKAWLKDKERLDLSRLSDMRNARLKDKETLDLSWNLDEEVLEKLQPHRSLKELTIKRYRGESFPNWIGNEMYSNMVSLELEDCGQCRSIPALGQLPSLKELYMTGFINLENLDSDFYGNSYAAKPFASLQILRIEGMPQWKEWYHRDGEAFPVLREFHLEDCPKLRGNLPAHLPSLIELKIDGCPDLAISLPEAPALSKLEIRKCNKFLGCSDGGLPSSLTSLWISDCDKEVVLDRGLHGLNSLTNLIIIGKCRGVISFPAEGILPKSLEYLYISCFDDLEMLEHKGFEHLTSLSKLCIRFCRKLKCIPAEGLPASLTYLEIYECPVLEGRLKRDGGEDWDKIAHIPQVRIG